MVDRTTAKPEIRHPGAPELIMDVRGHPSDPHPAAQRGRPTLSPITVPAVIVAEAEDCQTRIAALSVLDRLVVSLARAGVERIIVVGPTPPRLDRASAMGLQVVHMNHLPAGEGEVLVATGNVLATPADLRCTIENQARLVNRDNQCLPLGVLTGLSDDWSTRLDQVRQIKAKDLAARVTPDSADRLESAYWASLTSSSDGWVDRHFNRPAGRLLSKRLIHSPATPNQVSLIAILVGLAAAGLLATGSPGKAIAGSLVLQLSAILDCIDGDLARALFKQSSFGKWLDIVGDQLVHMGVFCGIGIGLWRSGSSAPVLILGIVAAIGVILSFLVVVRTLLQPSRRGQGRLQKLIDTTTNRDFSVLLIFCALFGLLDWFLWLAAIGSHVFWLVAAGLQIQESRRVQEHAPIP